MTTIEILYPELLRLKYGLSQDLPTEVQEKFSILFISAEMLYMRIHLLDVMRGHKVLLLALDGIPSETLFDTIATTIAELELVLCKIADKAVELCRSKDENKNHRS